MSKGHVIVEELLYLKMASTLTVADIQTMLSSIVGEISGIDTEEREYTSIEGLWSFELDNGKKGKSKGGKGTKGKGGKGTKGKGAATKMTMDKGADGKGEELAWYADAFDYWEDEANCPISDDGVLGGYGSLTPNDVRGSNQFLDKVKSLRPALQFDRVADCGAGIGRVTKHLLLPRCARVDLVEQSPRLIKAAPGYVGAADAGRLTCITLGLQDFSPAPGTYDIIWIQWVIGHLHDLDFIAFFRRCAAGLRPGGIIALKDNCVEAYTFVVDKSDSSVARHPEYHKLLFTLAGLTVVWEQLQTDFPTELYPVMMWALAPALDTQQPAEASTTVFRAPV